MNDTTERETIQLSPCCGFYPTVDLETGLTVCGGCMAPINRETANVVRAYPVRVGMPRVPRLLLVVESTHPIGSCRECAKAAHDAEIHARVTGSTGATMTFDNRYVGRETHMAKVAGKR